MNKFISIILKILAFFDFHPEVKKGTTRMAFVFEEQGFVVKFPILWVKSFFECLWVYIRYPKALWHFLTDESRVTHSGRFYLLKGILDNWREYLFFLSNSEETFIFPTYFSFFGLFNITPLGGELIGGTSIWSPMLNILGTEDAFRDNHHFSENENFAYYGGSIRMRDYGSKVTQRIILKHLTALNAFSIDSDLINKVNR